jgi:signal transduction histidine kinase
MRQETKKDWRRVLSLTTQGARTQFFIGVAVTLVLPLMVLVILFYGRSGYLGEWNPNPGVLAAATLALAIVGYVLLARYPLTVIRLREYLQAIISGEMPEKVTLVESESDIRAIRKSLTIIMSQLRERADLAERDKQRLERELKQAQKLRALGMASAGIAHEIKTPLQFVGANTHFLSQTVADLLDLVSTYRGLLDRGAAGEQLDTIVSEARAAEANAKLAFLQDELQRAADETAEGLCYISHALEAMRDFSRIEDSESVRPSDLNAMVESTVTVSRNVWKYAGLLETDLERDLPLVPCVGGDLRQVFLNLIVNAAHAIAPGGREDGSARGKIRVSTGVRDGFAEIRVADNGPGVPNDLKMKVFEPFFTTKAEGEGTGQGLAICRAIVEKKHGGTLTVEDADGGGAVFVVRLPLDPGTSPAA